MARGDDGFNSAWRAGRTLPPDQVIDVALGDTWDAGSTAGSDVGRVGNALAPGTLSGRELEIISLVARGLNNREIADELVISKRTVEWHIGKVLDKLRLRLRTQIMAWATEHPVNEPGA
jgi:DNA-binding NarL/FixJ family response regulator